MKAFRILSYLIFALLLAVCTLEAQTLDVLEAGPDDRLIQVVREEVDAAGATFSVTNLYTEVASGLNYWDGTTYQPSVPEFSIIGSEAVADQGQTTMVLPTNLNVAGAVYVVDREGKEYRSTPAFLALRNPANNQGIGIAALHDTAGELVAPDQVLYRDAFDLVAAAVRYIYRLDGVEQDVVLYEPLDPQQWNFPADSVLEMWTEVFGWPAPVTMEVTRAGNLDDVKLGFGGLDIGQGKAFSLEGVGTEVPIGKRFGKVGDRTFLVERVPYFQIKPLLDTLPQQVGGKAAERARRMAALPGPGSDAEMVAAMSVRRAGAKGTLVAEMQRGQKDRRQGVVLDYSAVTSGSSYVFDSGTTYYVSGTVNLAGATLNGGAVIKMDSTAATTINLTGPVTCRTSPYRPVIFTSKSDNTVGGFVAASDTGSPLPRNYGTPALKLNYTTSPFYLHDIAIRRAAVAIRVEAGSLSLTNVQIVSCGTGIYKAPGATTVGLRNLLVDDVGVMFDGAGTSGGANTGYHLTAHRISTFCQGTFAPIALVNSLLISVTNTAGLFTDPNSSVVVSLSDGGVFATPVGGGNHYLAPASPYRNVGAPLTDVQLLAELRGRTTYPPVALNGSVSTSSPLILSPQVQRDSGTADLGYHYSVIDFLANGLESVGGLTLTNGVVVAASGTSGIRLYYSAPFLSDGSVTRPNRIVWSSVVQEQPVTSGAAPGSRSLIELPYGATPGPAARFRFTETSLMSGDGRIINFGTYNNFIFASLDVKDCQFRGGTINIAPNSAGMVVSMVNNLFDFCDTTFSQNINVYSTQPFALTARNNLFRLGTLSLSKQSAVTTWTLKANLLDTTATGSIQSGVTIVNTHNGYRSGATQLPGATSSQVVTTFNYLTGPYGEYYYDLTGAAGTLKNLDAAGDVAPAAAGLKHHTVNGTTLAKDAGATVAIGFHYVATTSGIPFDGDADGVPDYVEDSNGDGATTGGETSFSIYNSPNGLATNSSLVLFSVLK